ncbi:cilia- and flagella-associated protein 206-like [Leptopilina boulardi]|uniref:cilia- and flagella-associated protein 206-like n=1 Tax=Leptopilina boulardi TaxID=63433 RepID=UPI0021F688BF|nr:cilia- and flagella-associated protein 206-like [Leptopilina boulardi]
MDLIKKDLIETITKECKKRDIDVSSDLVSFLLCLTLLNPEYSIEKSDEREILKVVSVLVKNLLDQNKPHLVTIKIQLYFAKHYFDRDEIIKKHRLRLHEKTASLVREICETKKLDSDRDMEKLYQKILVVITLLSGLGNPTVPSVLREVSLALQSVYQPSELSRYITLQKEEKEEQLMELMCIVAGIRLFNRDCERGGEGIDDLPSILQEAIKKTQLSIMELLEQLMQRIYKFTSAIENNIQIELSDDEEICSDNDNKKLTNSFTNDDIQWSIQMLAALRQQEIYIRKILCDIENCENELKNILERLKTRFIKLHETVRYRTAIPTSQVYPQFIDLADIWMSFQDEVIVLSNINRFLWQLQSLYVKIMSVYDECLLSNMIQDIRVLSDAERLEKSMGYMITECGECELFYPNSTKDFEKINLEFLGFCTWTFVQGKGFLLPGNPNIGVAKWRGKYFAFSSLKAARKFGENPNKCLIEILDFIRKRPEYVYLFQIYNDVEAIRNQEILTADISLLTVQQDQEVQTELHILPSLIDKNYSSNIWDYRRKALKLATICKLSTRSTQTQKSYFRRGIESQVEPPKNQQVQTRKENSTNTKKMQTYIFGLRGRRDNAQHVLTIVEDDLEK